ncbi:hypothetical protein M8C21_028701, partial [Ambrosia artemisiifolia]
NVETEIGEEELALGQRRERWEELPPLLRRPVHHCIGDDVVCSEAMMSKVGDKSKVKRQWKFGAVVSCVEDSNGLHELTYVCPINRLWKHAFGVLVAEHRYFEFLVGDGLRDLQWLLWIIKSIRYFLPLKMVEKCLNRLQELRYVTGGTKVNYNHL